MDKEERRNLRRSREMWQRTNSTGSFVSTNPLALLDENGNLKDSIDLTSEEIEAFGSLKLDDQVKNLLLKTMKKDDLKKLYIDGEQNDLGDVEEEENLRDSLDDKYGTLDAKMVKNYQKMMNDIPDRSQRRKMSLFPQASMSIINFRKSLGDSLDEVARIKVNGRTIISSGTIAGLIGVFVGVDEFDVLYLQEFLFTYRFFMKPMDLMIYLTYKHWYWDNDSNVSAPHDIKKSRSTSNLHESSQSELDNWRHFRRLRVVNVLKKWVTLHPADFVTGSELDTGLKKFIEENINNDVEGKYISSLKNAYEKRPRPVEPAPFVDFEKILSNKERMELNTQSYTSFKPDIMAEQLIIIEWNLLHEIQDYEIFNQLSNSDEAAGERLMRFATWGNKIHLWVTTEISIAKEKDRVSILKRLLLLAKYCRDLNNFNGLFEIITGLQLAPVQRLTKTWKNLPSKFKVIWQELNQIVSKDGNFKVYREIVAEAVKCQYPLIPAIRVMLSDMIEEIEKLPSFLDEGKKIVNFYKFHLLGQQLLQFRHAQEIRYNLKLQALELKWLQHSTVGMDINDIMRLSIMES